MESLWYKSAIDVTYETMIQTKFGLHQRTGKVCRKKTVRMVKMFMPDLELVGITGILQLNTLWTI
jgi:hypothetical protein